MYHAILKLNEGAGQEEINAAFQRELAALGKDPEPKSEYLRSSLDILIAWISLSPPEIVERVKNATMEELTREKFSEYEKSCNGFRTALIAENEKLRKLLELHNRSAVVSKDAMANTVNMFDKAYLMLEEYMLENNKLHERNAELSYRLVAVAGKADPLAEKSLEGVREMANKQRARNLDLKILAESGAAKGMVITTEYARILSAIEELEKTKPHTAESDNRRKKSGRKKSSATPTDGQQTVPPRGPKKRN